MQHAVAFIKKRKLFIIFRCHLLFFSAAKPIVLLFFFLLNLIEHLFGTCRLIDTKIEHDATIKQNVSHSQKINTEYIFLISSP